MPERFKTKYPGVFYIEGTGTRGPEKIYYIAYRKDGKLIEEKAGRQHKDAMTPAKAANKRARRIEGKELSNKERREAEKAARAAEAGKMTVTRLWDLYEKNLEGLKSRAADRSRFEKYIKPSFGTKEPQEILPLDIDRLQRKTLIGKSPQTIKHTLSLLRRLVRYGMKKRVCQGLIFDLDMPVVDNEVIETLSKEQLKRLLQVLHENEDIQISHLMLLALYTGMRKGELLKLQWKDIDFESGFIRIRSPKGKKSTEIPLNQAAREILEKHPRGVDHVFTNSRGDGFKEIKKRVEAIRTAAKLPEGFRPLHGLRHVYASMLASSGQVDMYTLQRLLTHKSFKTTQRYAYLRDEVLKAASEVASDIFRGVGK